MHVFITSASALGQKFFLPKYYANKRISALTEVMPMTLQRKEEMRVDGAIA